MEVGAKCLLLTVFHFGLCMAAFKCNASWLPVCRNLLYNHWLPEVLTYKHADFIKGSGHKKVQGFFVRAEEKDIMGEFFKL